MTEHQEIERFLLDYEEVTRAAFSRDFESARRATVALRRLLIDQLAARVARLVNRKIQLPFPDRFEFSVPTAAGGSGHPRSLSAIASVTQSDGIAKLDVDRFNREWVGRHAGDSFAVWDLVEFVAYVLGGIHANNKKATNEPFARLGSALGDQAVLAWTAMLNAVYLAVSRGLRELYRFHSAFDAFSNEKGLTAIFRVSLTRESAPRLGFVTDLWDPASSRRLSLYVNDAHEICLSLSDQAGRTTRVALPLAIEMFENLDSVVLRVAESRNRALVSVLGREWEVSREFKMDTRIFSAPNVPIRFRLGADRLGTQGGLLDMAGLMIFSRALPMTDILDLSAAQDEIDEKVVRFEGQQWLDAGPFELE